MSTVFLTQRVVTTAQYGETRDALDTRWFEFLATVGLTGIPLPNHLPTAQRILETVPAAGAILTGGGDLSVVAPTVVTRAEKEREAVEDSLLSWSRQHAKPLLGVCRGMQFLAWKLGENLVRTPGHVRAREPVQIHGVVHEVNSYHEWGLTQIQSELEPWAFATDGVIKAVSHPKLPWTAVMWHPERLSPFSDRDLALCKKLFGGA